jgi:hypothetical protein
VVDGATFHAELDALRVREKAHTCEGDAIAAARPRLFMVEVITRRNAMTQSSAMRGEKIYEYDFDITAVTDYGVSMDAILAGKETVPLQGARFDLAIEGRGKGRLSGRARGFDYTRMRADGRIDLDLHLTVETDDGHRISLSGDGQAAPRNGEPTADIFANIRLSSASKDWAWVNARQIWSVGTANFATGKIHVEAYMQ